MADNYETYTNENVTLHPKNDTYTNLYPRGVKSLSFGYNLVVNSNGQQFEGYKWVDIESPVSGGYTVKQLQTSGSEVVYDLPTIRNYMKLMTGTDYVPVYSASEPNDMFIYLSAPQYNDNERVWKYQYDASYGLVVFRVDNFPFALKSDIPSAPTFPKTLEGTCQVRPESNDIVVTVADTDLENSKAMSIRVFVRLFNKDEGGVYTEISNFDPIVCVKQNITENVIQSYYHEPNSNQYTFRLIVDQTQDFDLSDVEVASWTATLY